MGGSTNDPTVGVDVRLLDVSEPQLPMGDRPQPREHGLPQLDGGNRDLGRGDGLLLHRLLQRGLQGRHMSLIQFLLCHFPTY